MKTFREFAEDVNLILERGDRALRMPGESVADYYKRTRGKDVSNHPDLNPDEQARKSGKNVNVKSKDVGFGPNKQPSGTPPKTGAGTPPKTGAIVKSTSRALSTNVKPPVQKIKTNMNVPGGKKIPGLKSGGAISAALGTADEKMKGSGWARSLAKGAVVGTGAVLGGLAGGTAGSVAGPVGTAVGGYAGQSAGAAAAGKAFDTVAGANAKERSAIRQQKRQSQSGGALKGIGGKTTFDTKKGTMTTGAGSQKKTVQLGKTSVVSDPKTGKKETGYLAYKGGKAVYKRSDTSNATLAKTSSNPFERIGRTIAAGAYKKHDEKIRQQKLKQASASDIKRQQALGVKGSKNLVGPKIVGPKIVGPKK